MTLMRRTRFGTRSRLHENHSAPRRFRLWRNELLLMLRSSTKRNENVISDFRANKTRQHMADGRSPNYSDERSYGHPSRHGKVSEA